MSYILKYNYTHYLTMYDSWEFNSDNWNNRVYPKIFDNAWDADSEKNSWLRKLDKPARIYMHKLTFDEELDLCVIRLGGKV